MTKNDKIWLAGGISAFIFAILFMCNIFTTDRSINGKALLETDKYEISLRGGTFISRWRNFYRIKKTSVSEPLLINVKARYENLNYKFARAKEEYESLKEKIRNKPDDKMLRNEFTGVERKYKDINARREKQIEKDRIIIEKYGKEEKLYVPYHLAPAGILYNSKKPKIYIQRMLPFLFSKEIRERNRNIIRKYKAELQFYKMEKLYDRIINRDKMIYAMVNFNVRGVNPRKVELSGAAFSEVDKYFKGIKFTIRVGSRKNITVKVAEK